MRDPSRPLKLGIVAGEESGQRLALDLVEAIASRTGTPPELFGVGGEELQAHGLETVFDPNEIAITGLSAVLATLPRLVLRIGQTADALVEARPDAIILIDSPDFSHRVAKRVKARLPDVPIFKYVAPTVWAWRPERARKMKGHIDHVLAILPFEPHVMRTLDGPDTHYVGHPLAVNEQLASVWEKRLERPDSKEGIDLVMLPGSRRGELRALLPDFKAALEILCERGNDVRLRIPTLPRLEPLLRDETADWPVTPQITTDIESKIAAYAEADAALAASGTVILELALAGVPAISCYRTDAAIRLFVSLIKAWTAALPNMIADRPIVPEYYDATIRPGMLARRIEELAAPASAAAADQLAGFRKVRELMAVDEKPGEKAAGIILDVIG